MLRAHALHFGPRWNKRHQKPHSPPGRGQNNRKTNNPHFGVTTVGAFEGTDDVGFIGDTTGGVTGAFTGTTNGVDIGVKAVGVSGDITGEAVGVVAGAGIGAEAGIFTDKGKEAVGVMGDIAGKATGGVAGSVGLLVGSFDGAFVGFFWGDLVGFFVGVLVGAFVGLLVGNLVGLLRGIFDGVFLGVLVGFFVDNVQTLAHNGATGFAVKMGTLVLAHSVPKNMSVVITVRFCNLFPHAQRF